ncbi:MAG: rhomboid family intramembrane serine protease, partial [Bacilli bacterium]
MRNRKMDAFFLNIILICIVVYVLTYLQPGVQRSLIVYNFAVFKQFQIYRLVTYSFVHGSLLHLGSNMLSLYYLTMIIFNFVKKKQAYIIYSVAVIISALAAIIINPNTALVGTSGGVYGLLGIVLYHALKQKRRGYNQLYNQIIGVVVINLMISFLPGISLWGHIFGLLAGI